MTYESTAADIIFQSTLSVRRATCGRGFGRRKSVFQSTLSVRRATRNHQPDDRLHEFQSTLSVRRATGHRHRFRRLLRNFNPRSP